MDKLSNLKSSLLNEDIMDILGIEDDEVFMLKNATSNTILKDWFRYNNFGIEYFNARYDGWCECYAPNLTEVLNGSYKVIKCAPKVYSHETEILRR